LPDPLNTSIPHLSTGRKGRTPDPGDRAFEKRECDTERRPTMIHQIRIRVRGMGEATKSEEQRDSRLESE